MKVYLDNDNMCHRTFKEGYREAEHEYFDSIPPLCVEYYKFIPERNFIQCTDSKSCENIMRQYREDEEIINILTNGL